jgi:hypothetical protein
VTKATSVFTVQPPKLFTSSAIVISSLYGFVLMFPVVVAILGVTLLKFGLWTFLVPVAVIGAATYFLPLGFGNPYVTRLVRPLRPSSVQNQDLFVVQFSTTPRIRSGAMSLLEDADDVGVLAFTDSTVEFYGDSVRLSVPFSEIKDLSQRNAGSRALFAYGHQLVFKVPSLNEAAFRFAERSSLVLPSSRKIADLMYRQLKLKVTPATEPA